MTAKEFLRNMDIGSVSLNGQKFYIKESLEEAMIEFAKYHVEQAKDTVDWGIYQNDDGQEPFHHESNIFATINYPPENIK